MAPWQKNQERDTEKQLITRIIDQQPLDYW